MTGPNAAKRKQFVRAYLKTMDAEQAAQAIGRGQQGWALLEQPEVRTEIQRQRAALKDLCGRDDLIRRMWELAFGRPNDCVRLAMGELDRLDDLDLSLLAEIKRSDKGAVEVKLVDRMAVMERLLELTNNQADTASAFLQAIAAVGQEE